MRKWKHLNIAEFKQIKILLEAKVRSVQIAQITGRSTATIGCIKKAKDWQDYWKIRSPKKETPSPAEDDVPVSQKETRTIILHLDRIAVALEKIARNQFQPGGTVTYTS